MQISVRLYGALGRYRPAGAPPSGPFPWEAADGATAAQVAAELGIPPNVVRACAVNGETVPASRRLAPGDLLALVSAAGGG
ncbi:MAG TPA: MoaD/ThiS family protein [Chloroflexota bacterium]|nr:MoaD/ThiS family protein [Chloroflexota bacterium]